MISFTILLLIIFNSFNTDFNLNESHDIVFKFILLDDSRYSPKTTLVTKQTIKVLFLFTSQFQICIVEI